MQHHQGIRHHVLQQLHGIGPKVVKRQTVGLQTIFQLANRPLRHVPALHIESVTNPLGMTAQIGDHLAAVGPPPLPLALTPSPPSPAARPGLTIPPQPHPPHHSLSPPPPTVRYSP